MSRSMKKLAVSDYFFFTHPSNVSLHNRRNGNFQEMSHIYEYSSILICTT